MCRESVTLKICKSSLCLSICLATPSQFTGMSLKLNETNISTKNNMLKNTNGPEDYYLAICQMVRKLNQ